MLSFNRFISIIGIAIFMIACNSSAMEDINEAQEEGVTWEMPSFSELIHNFRRELYGFYEIYNGDAFDFDIVTDDRGLELLHYKLIEKHRGR